MNNSKTNNPQLVVVGELNTNCYIYALPDEAAGGNAAHKTCAVIDPGADAELIIDTLQELRLSARYILLTHGHLDHVAGLAGLARSAAVEPGCQIAIHKDDAHFLGAASLEDHVVIFDAAGAERSFVAGILRGNIPPAADIVLSDGDRIGPFTVLHSPGHSAGSACYYDEPEGVLFSGDTLFYHNTGRVDLPDSDEHAMAASIKKLLALPAQTRVYAGHGRDTTIAEERLSIQML
jgi:glyoxylase-like metal-dependent hydrolase (beta-lactamase superfamily II)